MDDVRRDANAEAKCGCGSWGHPLAVGYGGGSSGTGACTGERGEITRRVGVWRCGIGVWRDGGGRRQEVIVMGESTRQLALALATEL